MPVTFFPVTSPASKTFECLPLVLLAHSPVRDKWHVPFTYAYSNARITEVHQLESASTGNCSWAGSSFEWKCGKFWSASIVSMVWTSPFCVYLQLFLQLRFRAKIRVVADLVIHGLKLLLEISMQQWIHYFRVTVCYKLILLPSYLSKNSFVQPGVMQKNKQTNKHECLQKKTWNFILKLVKHSWCWNKENYNREGGLDIPS